MKRVLILILLLSAGSHLFAQDEKDSTYEYYPYSNWPYVGEQIPPYVTITGGIETIKSHYYLIGLSYSMSEIFSTAFDGFGGLRVYYKQDMNKAKNRGFEADWCVAGGLIFGLNYNFTQVSGNNVHGFKPFVGVSLLHTHFYYGYCFYKDSRDAGNDLVHNRFTLSIDIPVFKATKKKFMRFEKDRL